MPPDEPIRLQDYVTFRLARVHAKLVAEGARLLKRVAGLSVAQWRIIALLGTYGEATPAELTRHAEFDKGHLSRKVRQLVDQGLVAARPHDTDRRVHVLSLTREGRRLFRSTLPHTRARQERLRGLLLPEEVDTLFRAFDKIEAALDAEDRP